jgi:uncharacterized protein (UPF0335 family)
MNNQIISDALKDYVSDYQLLLDEKADIVYQEKQMFRDMKQMGISQKAFKAAFKLINDEKAVEDMNMALLYYNALKE